MHRGYKKRDSGSCDSRIGVGSRASSSTCIGYPHHLLGLRAIPNSLAGTVVRATERWGFAFRRAGFLVGSSY